MSKLHPDILDLPDGSAIAKKIITAIVAFDATGEIKARVIIRSDDGCVSIQYCTDWLASESLMRSLVRRWKDRAPASPEVESPVEEVPV